MKSAPRTFRALAVGLFCFCWVIRAGALPAIQNLVVQPTPLTVGNAVDISVNATDVAQATATVDFRPWSTRVLRVTLSLQAGQWKGAGLVPADLVPPGGAEATVKVLVFNAARQFAERTLRVAVLRQSGITAVYNPGNGVLTVTGNDLDNQITVSRDGAGSLRVNNGSVPITGGVATVANSTLIRVLGLGGHDQLTLDSANGPLPSGDLQGGAGNDVLTGGPASDDLDGGPGADTLAGRGGNDRMFGGPDPDALIWNPGDGSDVVEGQAGTDVLRFNGSAASETIDVSANGARLRFFRNVANVVMDCDDVEEVQFHALGGSDIITVNSLVGTDVTRVDLDLASVADTGVGDGQADTVVVSGSQGNDVVTLLETAGELQVNGLSAALRIRAAEGSNDQLAFQAQGGDDVVNASGLPAGRIGLVINGGLGADLLIGSAGNDLIAGGDGNDTVLAGGGDDQLVWNPGDDNDVFEGQAGADVMIFNGANVSENINISANGGRVIFFRNIANVVMDLNDMETIRYHALGGADTVVVNDLSGTDVVDVDIDLANPAASGNGDGQSDSVTVQGTSGDDVVLVFGDATGVTVIGLAAQVHIGGSEVANDRLVINALAGDDVVEASGLPDGHLRLVADGGEGNDILVGSGGPDTLLGGPGDDVLLGGDGLDVLDGGPGDDVELQ
ncbi:MAG: hypothetical protein JNK85_10860 [Verrucomicrobiales bacterium]|nr:hypothetical protein [Verrucomicrobiales bacterium]